MVMLVYRFTPSSFVCLALINLLGFAGIAKAAITFQDVTATAGPFHTGEGWGAAWGDFNGDGRPDLHGNNHRHRDSIYRNNGDGTFSDVTLQMDVSNTWIGKPKADTHGGAWADFNRDGDQDLLVSTGACCAPFFFVNENGVFFQQASAYNLTSDGSGRFPSWLDSNDDGKTDIFMAKISATALLWRQGTPTFSDQASQAGMTCSDNQYAQLSDLDNDGRMELICARQTGTFPQRVYDTSDPSDFTDITTILPATGGNDTAFADFDGNLRPDLFLVRGNLRPDEVLKISDTRIEAKLLANSSGERGGTFTGSGPITITIDSVDIVPGEIFIGSGGSHPASNTFTLDPLNPSTHGIKPHNPATNQGVYVGLVNAATQEWKILAASGGGSVTAYLTVDGSSFSEPAAIGLSPQDLPIKPKLFLNTATGFQDQTTAKGLNTDLSCASAAAADLDNDRDMDLYLVCRGGVQNLPDRLFEQGSNGVFVERQGHGAEGIVGQGLQSGAGTGDSVTVVDYNLDGFLDLFVTNGLNIEPLRVGGPDQLFRNTSNGNGNHWVLLELKGTSSNADGIGATVLATAGGVTQLREQNGGYHRWSQNHSHVHFGLGGSTTVDLEVRWPRGQVDEFFGVAADKLYRVTEGGSSPVEVGRDLVSNPVPEFPPLQLGEECNKPLYDRALDGKLFLWKNCSTGLWSLRASGGGSATTVTYEGDVSSDQPFTSVTPMSIEGGDIVNHTTPPPLVHYRFNVSNTAEDGFDFNFPAGANVCLSVNTPGAQVLVGPRRKVAPLPFKLGTPGSC